ARMERDSMLEALLHLERAAVINRAAYIAHHNEVAQIGVESSGDERLARGQHAGLEGVQVGGVSQQADAVHHQITGGDRHAAAHFVRYLQAGLKTVRRLQIRVDIVGQRADAGRGNFAGGQKSDGGGSRVGAGSVNLAEAAGEGRYTGVGLLRVG